MKLSGRARRYLGAVTAPAVAEGARIADCAITGRSHIRIDLTYGGAIKAFFIPGSPSDHRGLKNGQRDMLRWVEQLKQESR